MPNDYFSFKQFTIYQDKCAMKVGTDGVLLGAWTDVSKAKSILDVGTGTGLIAIMLAQRTDALIDAVETDENAYMQACSNSGNCPWSKRIQIQHASFQEYAMKTNYSYDLIVSNPPYFINSLKNPGKSKETARHTTTLSYSDLLKNVSKLLSDGGILSVILPVEKSKLFIIKAQEYGLLCNKKVNIIPRSGKPAKRMMMQFSKTSEPLYESSLIIELGKRHQYSEEYISLTKEYYLLF
jgi:tRNA1Val (adenine37-N6)-methyltransferase